MKHHLHALALASLFTLAACGGGTDTANNAVDEPDASDAQHEEDVSSPDAGGDAVTDPAPDTSEDAIPEEITTAGASFGGSIGGGESIEVSLQANEGDRIIVWLRVDGEPSWNPSVSIYEGDHQLVFGNPSGNADAHIPYQASEIDQGWEFYEGGQYRLLLENFADVDGRFSLELECVSGPCSDTTDTDGDGVFDSIDNCASEPNAGQEDGDGDGVGDVCDSGQGNDSFEGLSNAQLEQAIRTSNQDHRTLSYAQARDEMFGTVDNHGGQVECVYTGQTIQTTDRGDAYDQGFNAEHTWPQSRGAEFEPAQSDLHHLFPTTAESNQYRSNNFFGEVTGNVSWSGGGSKLGEDQSGATRFEPRDVHKGNVARALFYFAVVYQHDIPGFEEDVLRQWHTADPVDAAESARNDAVDQVQNSRNPFIDQPELVERIADF